VKRLHVRGIATKLASHIDASVGRTRAFSVRTTFFFTSADRGVDPTT
jgi:hypothetical protein